MLAGVNVNKKNYSTIVSNTKTIILPSAFSFVVCFDWEREFIDFVLTMQIIYSSELEIVPKFVSIHLSPMHLNCLLQTVWCHTILFGINNVNREYLKYFGINKQFYGFFNSAQWIFHDFRNTMNNRFIRKSILFTDFVNRCQSEFQNWRWTSSFDLQPSWQLKCW